MKQDFSEPFVREVMTHPVTNQPEHKRSFVPSKWERLKVSFMDSDFCMYLLLMHTFDSIALLTETGESNSQLHKDGLAQGVREEGLRRRG